MNCCKCPARIAASGSRERQIRPSPGQLSKCAENRTRRTRRWPLPSRARLARELTPNIVPPDSMVLQPSDERRRSGSHYTPRGLTEPIVRKTLEPVLQRSGANPTPEQILDLKVCDPAMGSGAFLVDACRFLADCWSKPGTATIAREHPAR